MVRELGKEDAVDLGYYETLCDKARDAIAKYGDFGYFVSGADDWPPEDELPF